MMEDKQRKLYSLLAKALYMFAECKCTNSEKLSKFIEEVKRELPAKLPNQNSNEQINMDDLKQFAVNKELFEDLGSPTVFYLKKNRPSLSQILSNDPTFAAAVKEQLKEIEG